MTPPGSARLPRGSAAQHDPGMLALAVGLARFARALAGFLLAVVRETRGTPDPITMVPRVLRDAPTVPMPERMRDEARTGSGER